MLRATDGRPYGKVLRSDRGVPSPAEERPYRRTSNARPYVIVATLVFSVGDDAHIVPRMTGVDVI